MISEEYRSYLRSAEWKEKREEFIEAVDGQCEECGEKKKLQVHHLNYDNIYDETQDDVMVLCSECHRDKELEKGNDMHEGDYGTW